VRPFLTPVPRKVPLQQTSIAESSRKTTFSNKVFAVIANDLYREKNEIRIVTPKLTPNQRSLLQADFRDRTGSSLRIIIRAAVDLACLDRNRTMIIV
jgi:hypothetical protein